MVEKIQIERTDMNVVRWTKRTTSRQIEMESYARQAIRLRQMQREGGSEIVSVRDSTALAHLQLPRF